MRRVIVKYWDADTRRLLARCYEVHEDITIGYAEYASPTGLPRPAASKGRMVATELPPLGELIPGPDYAGPRILCVNFPTGGTA